ncbi:MAG: orotate phosphoribosyltransferase [Bacteroidota bacterium]|nr:orotate phosphoribosyltransferase [Bacteroidota bacterium]
MSLLSQHISDRLLQIKAIKLNAQNPFTWASGLRSPIYCDNRKILSFPDVRTEVVNGLEEMARINLLGIDAIAGVATAGIAWGALLADRMKLPFCYVRSAPKEHGLKNMIEGQLPKGSQVLVVEDLISTGGSALLASQALENESFKVLAVLSIFQYNFPDATTKFELKKLKLLSLTNFHTLLEQALQSGLVTHEDHVRLKSWNANPKLWSDMFLTHN